MQYRDLVLTTAILSAACGSVPTTTDAPPADGPLGDASADAAARLAWGTPVALTELNSAAGDAQITMSDDRLKVCFTSLRPGGVSAANDLWCAQRQSATAPFAAPVNQGRINSTAYDWMPSLSGDGLTLYFSSDRTGDHDLYRATWDGAQFVDPRPLTALNTAAWETGADISSDGLTLVFDSNRDATFDLYVATRPSTTVEFPSAVRLDSLASSGIEQEPSLSPDGTLLAFCSTRLDLATLHLYVARRSGSDWDTPTLVELDEPPGLDGCGPELASDGSLLIHSMRPGGLGEDDLYVAPPAGR